MVFLAVEITQVIYHRKMETMTFWISVYTSEVHYGEL